MSQLTTHILDTSKGKPAAGVAIVLYQSANGGWTELTRGVTNVDGRIPDLLKTGITLAHGTYKMRFDTKAYFDQSGTSTFYPYVEIVFDIHDQEHYHVPLLLNPYGYSTYRGS